MTLIAPDARIDRDSGRGMALMAGAMMIVPGLDAIAKYLGETLSPFQIGFTRYALQSLILIAAFAVLGRPILTAEARAALPRLALAGALMGTAVGLLFWSFRSLPLANAIAIFFVGPLILTVFSAVFLRERVGWHRTSAVLVGLLGALVVIRPNFAMFGFAAILPLLAAACFAGVMTTMRAIPGGLDSLRIQTVSGMFAAAVLGLALLAGETLDVPLLSFAAPSATGWALLLFLGAVATLGQMMITGAVRLAEASLLAPFQYLEIIGATLYGYLIFGDFPDTLTWVGTAIILAAGLYVIHRERRLARARRAALTVP